MPIIRGLAQDAGLHSEASFLPHIREKPLCPCCSDCTATTVSIELFCGRSQMNRRELISFAVTLVATAFVVPRAHADSVSDFLAKWDPDNDRTLDLAEVNKAADAQFDKLDVDHDGTLNRKELGNRVTKAEFAAADTDHEGTLSKEEYQTIVAKRFHAANRDKDTTIDIAELRSKAGRHLLQLLQ
jgi:hypothetical protein